MALEACTTFCYCAIDRSYVACVVRTRELTDTPVLLLSPLMRTLAPQDTSFNVQLLRSSVVVKGVYSGSYNIKRVCVRVVHMIYQRVCVRGVHMIYRRGCVRVVLIYF